jgi:hypothetical protein
MDHKSEVPAMKKELTVIQSDFPVFLNRPYWVQVVKGACGVNLKR